MSRIFCIGCQRPQKACICAFTTAIANDIHVVVLQHPSEVSQTKGTVALLAKSLQSCQVLVGEAFDDHPCFLNVLAHYQAVLLYPGEQAQVLSHGLLDSLDDSLDDLVGSVAPLLKLPRREQNIENSQLSVQPMCLVILDGTWKKAYRMFMLSKKLPQLPQVCLPEYLANAGQYHIRKVAKKNALSSLEACCYALALLEQTEKYQPLLEKFNQFNQFQLSFRPEHNLL